MRGNRQRVMWMVATAIALVVAIVVASVSIRILPNVIHANSRHYCALLDNATGLYKGNSVTVHGVPVGKIVNISSGSGPDVRVELTVNEDAPAIPANVDAVTRSNSILADRSLELSIPSNMSSEPLSSTTCISRKNSFTPHSITDLTDSGTRLINSIVGTGDSNAVSDLLAIFQSTIHGRASDINETLRGLATVSRDYDPMIADFRQLLNETQPLVHQANELWPTISSLMADTRTSFAEIPNLFENLSAFFDTSLVRLIKVFYNVNSRYGDRLSSLFDRATGALRPVAAQAPLLQRIANMVPALTESVVSPWRSGSGAAAAGAPTYRVRTSHADILCARINAIEARACQNLGNGTAQVSASGLLRSQFGTAQ